MALLSSRSTGALVFLSGVGVFSALACSSKAPPPDLTSSPPDGLQWGEGGPSFLTEPTSAEAYAGDNSAVNEAQRRLPTGSALHSEVILRSCGPLGGVCHNRKEYPDLRSPSNFLGVIGAPCNVQSGTPEGIFDRCERPGDRIRLSGVDGTYEIGWLEVVPGEYSEEGELSERPGLHIYLGDTIDTNEFRNSYKTANFERSFVSAGDVEVLGFATYSGRWHLSDDGRQLLAEVPNYRREVANGLVTSGISQGDMNRNGVFGARPDDDGKMTGALSLIEPGDPETSYLVARLRGHMQGKSVPGTRMPLANPPFSVAEMISLFCFIEGIPENGVLNLASDIDYKNCSYAEPKTHEALQIEGAGKNWSDRVSPLLEANCGGCHSEERALGGLVLVGEEVLDSLLATASPTDKEGRLFISAGDPTQSYLYLKLINDPSIVGKGMPIDPLAGTTELSKDELADIEAWIRDGAAP